tara:strand:+ start:151798 stop:152187 length:390 start_codon:yes stop_codon:yes gene_type:complete
MTLIKRTLLGLAITCGTTMAAATMAADCVQPQAPTMPDGAKAALEDMLAGQKAVKAFQASNLEYMTCVQSEIDAAEKMAIEAKSDDAKAAAQAKHQDAVNTYNAAVSKEEEVAGQFNTEIREYKAANPS